MHKKLGEDRVCNSGDMMADRQTHKQTDTLITILHHRYRERSNDKAIVDINFAPVLSLGGSI